MHRTIDEWKRSLPQTLQSEIEKIIDVSKKYFSEHSNFFRNCGFYVVGSSLVRPDFDDIDLVLVGLDFREVFSYTDAFLDPDKLSEETKRKAQKNDEGIGHYCIFEIESQPQLAELVKKITATLPQYNCDEWNYSPFTG